MNFLDNPHVVVAEHAPSNLSVCLDVNPLAKHTCGMENHNDEFEVAYVSFRQNPVLKTSVEHHRIFKLKFRRNCDARHVRTQRPTCSTENHDDEFEVPYRIGKIIAVSCRTVVNCISIVIGAPSIRHLYMESSQDQRAT